MGNVTHKSSFSSNPLPLKNRFVLWIITTVIDAATHSNGTVNRRLLDFVNVKVPANLNPVKGVKSYDVTVNPSRNLWFRVFDPTQQPPKNLPVVIFFHGGGFLLDSPDNIKYDTICRRFAVKIPAAVVSVNYRLSPEHPYPAQYEDGFDVIKFLDGNQKLLPENAKVSECFLAGDSAGGNLAHHVAKKASVSDFRQLKVIGMVSIQPFFGGEERTESEKKILNPIFLNIHRTDWAWKAFVPEGDRDHKAINVSGPRAADISPLRNFPATIVFVGGLDILQDWQKRYYEWLKKCGKEAYLVEYPNAFHGFYVFPEMPEFGKLIAKVKEFVHNQRPKLRSVK